MVSRDDFRAAMAQIGSAVSIITTDGEAGRYGITVSAMCSVSDDPPSLLVCVNRGSGANAIIKENGRLCVNVLSCDQEPVGSAFARPDSSIDARFSSAGWTESALGNPYLDGSAAAFDCTVSKSVEFGTHTVFFCEVSDVRRSENAGCLVYHQRSFHPILGVD